MKRPVNTLSRWLLPLFLLLLAACHPSDGKKPGIATREVVDMAGRRMTVPAIIERAYSTRPGSVTLYAIAPDLMVNRSLWMTDGAERFMSPAYLKLPFSDGSAEEIVRLHPDVIISYFSINRQSIANCFCVWAAMLILPSPVGNVPEGLAKIFWLPMGTGTMPAMSEFTTTQPIAASVDSSIDTSMNSPSPVRACRNKAAQMAKAAVMPAIASLAGKPTRSGPDVSSPVTLISPDRPWMIWS